MSNLTKVRFAMFPMAEHMWVEVESGDALNGIGHTRNVSFNDPVAFPYDTRIRFACPEGARLRPQCVEVLSGPAAGMTNLDAYAGSEDGEEWKQ